VKPRVEPFGDARVRLRPLHRDDLPMTRQWRNRDEVRKWFKHPEVITAEGHAAWYAQYEQCDNDFMFIVEDIESGEAVGQVAIYGVDDVARHAEIGRFIVAPGHEGHGHMKAAIGLLCRWASGSRRLASLFLEVFAHNVRAIGLYRACGFVEVRRDAEMIVMQRSLA
jgi:diamine N-acetyltransferase